MQNYLIFKTVQDLIKKHQFLPVDYKIDKYFSGTDTKKLFKENLKTQPDDWIYRNRKITYTLNSRGYRTNEFKKIDWANSIVVFGCSNVFGIGLDDQDTICKQLEKITGIPVVNMGVGGSSITFSLHNAIILRDGYPTPKAVVNLWPGPDRTVYYYKNKVENCGVWNAVPNGYMDVWTSDESHGMTHALLASITSKHLWANTSYYEASFWMENSKLMNCDFLLFLDYARDLSHPGIKTSQAVAEQIAKNIL
jgi:hypothetical protein